MTFAELKTLWDGLEDVPVVIDADGDTVIDRDYGMWKKGTSREAIWQWFDGHCANGVVNDLMYDKEDTLE